MSAESNSPQRTPTKDFAREAESPDPGLLREFLSFLVHNKKWWLLPILIVLLLMGILIVLSATPAAPFIYPVF